MLVGEKKAVLSNFLRIKSGIDRTKVAGIKNVRLAPKVRVLRPSIIYSAIASRLERIHKIGCPVANLVRLMVSVFANTGEDFFGSCQRFRQIVAVPVK